MTDAIRMRWPAGTPAKQRVSKEEKDKGKDQEIVSKEGGIG